MIDLTLSIVFCTLALFVLLLFLQIIVEFIPGCPLKKLLDFHKDADVCFFTMFLICAIIAVFTNPITMFYNNYVQKALPIKPSRLRLGEVMISRGYITCSDLEEALEEQKLKFGEILLDEGIISRAQLQHALSIQKSENIKIGQIMKELGYLKNKHIKATLRKMNRRLGEIFVYKGYYTEAEIDQILNRMRWEENVNEIQPWS